MKGQLTSKSYSAPTEGGVQFFILFWGGGQSILMNTGGRDVDELHSCEKGTLLTRVLDLVPFF